MKRTSRDIRIANRFNVLRHILAAAAVSRQEIAQETSLSFATVSNLVAELLAMDLLREVGFQDSGGGRPRGLVSVNPSGGFLIGVDVAETYIHVELFDAALTVLAAVEEPLLAGENQPEQVLEHVVLGIDRVLAEASVATDRVLGAGVSVPGQVDPAGGVSVFAPNWSWHDVPMRSMLCDRLTMPLYLDNPLRASAVAELWFGAGRGFDDVAVLNLGTGVGAGLAIGGALHRGATNSSGEWGHTALVLDGRPCRCGSRGCLEAYVGAPGIMQNLREVDPESPLLHDEDQTATIQALGTALAEADPVALRTIEVTARYLGTAIGDLINLLNPEVIVLSSWVATSFGQSFLDQVRAVAVAQALGRPAEAVQIVLGSSPGNPVSLGAATFALERFLASIGVPSDGLVRGRLTRS